MARELVKELVNDKDFVDALVDRLADKVSNKFKESFDQLNAKIAAIEKKCDKLQTEYDEIHQKLDYFDQFTKQNKLRIYGVPECPNDKLMQNVQGVLKNNLNLADPIDITYCHRIGNHSQNNGNRAVLVSFGNIAHRNLVYNCKRRLKGTKMVIVEELTKDRHELYLFAKEKLGSTMVWTAGGQILTKIRGKKIQLRSVEDVEKIVI
nr:unnamed protein product [Callosobruchus analis]